jgi:hypothetical protein
VNTDLARVLERVRQNRTARARELAGNGTNDAGTNVVRSAPTTAGARAFDTVSGEFVEVISGIRENVVIPATGRRGH